MKKVIVTGAGKGLGRAISIELGSLGYKIVGVDVDQRLLQETKKLVKSEFEPIQLDVSDCKAVSGFFSRIETDDLFGLVNNAGVYFGKNILDYSPDEIGRVVDINLKGAIFCSKYFGELFVEDGREGCIVNISSSSIYGGSDPVYSSTKAGLVGLTKACAMRFSPYIRANAVAPGIVSTDILQDIPQNIIEWYRKTELVKKPLEPKDVAETVSFLFSDQGKNYTGSVFDLNNGFHM